MLRDSLVGLIEPMFSSAGTYPLALSTEWKRSSDDRPPCLENPRPEGAESTLTENALSPFHAEPKQHRLSNNVGGVKHFLSVLLRALRRARHFALVEDVPIQPRLARNQFQVWNSVRPMHLFGHYRNHDY